MQFSWCTACSIRIHSFNSHRQKCFKMTSVLGPEKHPPIAQFSYLPSPATWVNPKPMSSSWCAWTPLAEGSQPKMAGNRKDRTYSNYKSNPLSWKNQPIFARILTPEQINRLLLSAACALLSNLKMSFNYGLDDIIYYTFDDWGAMLVHSSLWCECDESKKIAHR